MKLSELQQSQPALYDKLRDIESVLERHYKDMQVMGEGWWVMGDGR